MTIVDFETVAGLTGRQAQRTGDTYTITLTRDYDFAIDDVWSAWTDPDRLSRWLGVPSGELTVGSHVDLVMSPPDDDVAGLTITACDAPRALEVRWTGWDEPPSTVRLELAPLGDHHTRVVLSHSELGHAGAVAYGAGWEEFLQLCSVHLRGTGTRDEAGYDRAALEAMLHVPWEEVLGPQ
ncbi:MAG: SRPBCC domain-containing protein [Acidimicrobiales bacterium]